MTLGAHDVITWLIIGLIAGALAGRLVRSKPSGCILNILVGLAGAFIGGALLQHIGPSVVTGTILDDIVVAFVGAVILLGLLRLFEGKGNGRGRR
jgi:uncharacterized membrane protein YeaQ/YmgE (transglycosylase-associated protein family)